MLPQDWVPPTYSDLRTAHFELDPFHCVDCGCDRNFKHPNFSYRAPNKKSIMLQGPHNICLCGNCLAARIEKWFALPEIDTDGRVHRKMGECDICCTLTSVADIIWDEWVSCRFGSNWWNGHWICCDCLAECAWLGVIESSVIGYHNGKRYASNEVGARIEMP